MIARCHQFIGTSHQRCCRLTRNVLRHEFARQYDATLALVLTRRVSTALATIYEPHFDEPGMRAAVGSALPLFNDIITRLAFRHAIPLLDLRLICNEARDFTSGIEPSAQGSDKIATALVHVLGGPDDRAISFVYAGYAVRAHSPAEPASTSGRPMI